jgi:hypothetical protein
MVHSCSTLCSINQEDHPNWCFNVIYPFLSPLLGKRPTKVSKSLSYIPLWKLSTLPYQIVQFVICALYIPSVYNLTSYVALIAILLCPLFLQTTPKDSRTLIREAFQVYVRSSLSTTFMAAVKQQVSGASNSVTEADGPELFRLVMAHSLEVTPHSDVQG